MQLPFLRPLNWVLKIPSPSIEILVSSLSLDSTGQHYILNGEKVGNDKSLFELIGYMFDQRLS